MGKENTESVGNEKTGNSTAGSPNPTGTGNSGGGRGAGRGRGAAAGKPSEKDLQLSNVTAPKVVTVEVPGNEGAAADDAKPKRGRPTGAVAKKKKAPVKKQAIAMDHTQLSLLLVTMTGILATRENMEPFSLTMEEANQISLPLASILGKNEGLASATAEYADHIALVFAAATIIIPKFLVYKAAKNERELDAYALYQYQTGEVSRDDNDTHSETRNTPNVQSDSGSFNGAIGEFLSPLGGY